MATPTQLKSLKIALSRDRAPLCSGAISPPPEGFHLWYDKKNLGFIDFTSSAPEDIDPLVAACDSTASSHRAAKMDVSNFSAQLDVVGTGLIRAIENQFLQGDGGKVRIRAEICELNIHGKDSTSGSYEDTHRDKATLGWLVIIYPTHYEGGEFVFRYEGREWKFDANSLTASRPSPSLAYIAFRTDVEHEVLTVTSGHRITLTYKLYLDDPALESGAPAVIPNTSTRSDFRTTLYDLLESPEFFPEGGTLGFGLVCPYTLTFPMDLKKLAKDLKGEDAQVYQTCRDLELQTSLRMIYDDSESRKFGIMLDRVVREPLYDVGGIFGSDVADSYEAALVKDDGGVPVNKLENANLGDCKTGCKT